MNNPLLDKNFLNELDKNNQREIYAKIISLTSNELPIEEITGTVTQGTLSIDGSSRVRRTCSLSLVANRLNINEYYWSFATKFKLIIGLKMTKDMRNKYSNYFDISVDPDTGQIFVNNEPALMYQDYPDIIWFKQGTFLITSFKYILNTNGTDNIYISGKDKMALLNGDISGTFMHTIDVGTEEILEYDDEMNVINRTQTPLTIKQIITELIHKYGNEPIHNIIVNDLDDNGLIMLDYNGENDIYLFKNIKTGLFENVLFDGDIIRYDKYNNPIKLSSLKEYELDSLASNYISTTAKLIKNTDNILDTTYFTIVKCSYGSIVGYRTTDWTYPSEGGELIINAGQTVTQALDSICNVFDNEYEYFYDIDGRFVFQKKITYINTHWNNLLDTWELNKSNNELEKTTYVESDKLVSQFSYSFIGNQLMTTFNNSPNINNVKNDFAIWGKRKAKLNSKENAIHLRCAIDEKPEKYVSFDNIEYTSDKWDWRELIYQMAQDYYNHNHDDDYEIVLHKNNPTYPFGKTGYEAYYEDMLGFWRLIYNPQSKDNDKFFIKRNDNELLSDFQKRRYWNRDVINNPSALVFWFDFINGKTSDLNKYSVKAIGNRPKIVNNDKIRAIYYGEVPTLIYITLDEYRKLKNNNLLKDGYTYIILPESIEEYFDATRKQKSTQDELDNLLYQHSYCTESITINTIPIYYLEPNTRISVYDEKTKINGEYIVNKFVITLNYNGTMQIMATKAPTRLF